MHDFRDHWRGGNNVPHFRVDASPLFILFIGSVIVAAVVWDLIVRIGLHS